MDNDPTLLAEPPSALVWDQVLIDAEFDAIIAAEWPVPRPQQSVRATGCQLQPGPGSRRGRVWPPVGSFQPSAQLAVTEMPGRQRSPPLGPR